MQKSIVCIKTKIKIYSYNEHLLLDDIELAFIFKPWYPVMYNSMC